jgi:hypothetical protein
MEMLTMLKARQSVLIPSADLWVAGSLAWATPKHEDATTPDRIDVIAHMPAEGGPFVQLITTAHWRRNYLYLERAGDNQVTVVDVTNPMAPTILKGLALPREESTGSLTTIVGSIALVSSSPALPTTQTVTILSFRDPEHPTVVKRFAGVTETVTDAPRNLIYLANNDGIWVLRMMPGTDVQLQKDYEKQVLYGLH